MRTWSGSGGPARGRRGPRVRNPLSWLPGPARSEPRGARWSPSRPVRPPSRRRGLPTRSRQTPRRSAAEPPKHQRPAGQYNRPSMENLTRSTRPTRSPISATRSRASSATAFASVWVVGEVQRVRESRARAPLLRAGRERRRRRDPGQARLRPLAHRPPAGQAPRSPRATSGSTRATDALPRRGRLLPAGRPAATRGPRDRPPVHHGPMAQRRQQTLEALARAGLMERNKELPLPEVPLDSPSSPPTAARPTTTSCHCSPRAATASACSSSTPRSRERAPRRAGLGARRPGRRADRLLRC